jgi:hypothetical protein
MKNSLISEQKIAEHRLKWVSSDELDFWWPMCVAQLSEGLSSGEGETHIEQLRLYLTEARCNLVILLNNKDDVIGSLAIQFVNLPNIRIGFIHSIGGRSLLADKDVWSTFKFSCKQRGASSIRASCKPSQSRLFRRIGFNVIYEQIEIKLL